MRQLVGHATLGGGCGGALALRRGGGVGWRRDRRRGGGAPVQAPRVWFERFASVVTVAGFRASAHDPALFIHLSTRGRTVLLLYVDDMTPSILPL